MEPENPPGIGGSPMNSGDLNEHVSMDFKKSQPQYIVVPPTDYEMKDMICISQSVTGFEGPKQFG